MRGPPKLGLVAAAEIPNAQSLAGKLIKRGLWVVIKSMRRAFYFGFTFALAVSALPISKRYDFFSESLAVFSRSAIALIRYSAKAS